MNIEIQNVTFTYPAGVTALRGVSLAFGPGQVAAILGENGAGKTTLARHLNGLQKPTSGRVLVGDWNTRDYSAARLARRVGYLFQNPDEQLFARTIWDEVAFGPRNLGRPAGELDVLVGKALEETDLTEMAQRHPYDLRPSQRKWVALAATLAMDTPVLVLDEPTTGLDAREVARAGRIVDRLRSEGRTLVIISHDVDFCAEHCDRIAVMAQGQVLACGEAREILGQTALLARAEVEPPELVRLAAALGWAQIPLAVPAFVEAFAAHLDDGDAQDAHRSG